VCTRNCKFCAIAKDLTLLPPDVDEPQAIADLSKELGLKHVVITTVTRDDLPDGGASQFVAVINALTARWWSFSVRCGNQCLKR
ncbi:MAG: hypothetical protein B6226_02285, partial [Candidatus Cloacimonetes bacterium 4572_65]